LTGLLFIDLETYSSVDLRKSNVYRYSESDDFEILMAGWSRDGKNYQLAVGEPAIKAIPTLWDPNVLKIAHNAPFERICLSTLVGIDGYLPSEQFVDTQALAAEAGYPQGLEKLAAALGGEQKDTAGTRLINLFCKPYRGERVFPHEKPEQWEEFCNYCVQDVRTLYDVWASLPDWPTTLEEDLYHVDQRINDRGIRIDVELAKAAHRATLHNKLTHEAEVRELTGVDNPGSVQQLTTWFHDQGVRVPNLQAETVQKLLAKDPPDPVRRVLRLRQELALTSSSKYAAALSHVSMDGRLRGQFRFHGAHTGRWAGRGMQLHNLARLSFEDSEGNYDFAMQDAVILDLLLGLGATSENLKRIVRPLFQISGVVVDYKSVEAVVLAWLADEEWVLQAFRDGRDLYVETAKRMGGLTRFQGKIAVLALGYNGGIGSLRSMGGPELGSDEQLQVMVNQWRKANPKITRMWKAVDRAFRRGHGKVGKLVFSKDGSTHHITLPSGRRLSYHGVRATGDRITFNDPKGFRTDTYGGRLAENVTSAVARDLLAEALIRLDAGGYPVVAHVHDEVAVEGDYPVQEIVDVMCQLPDWASGMPLGGDGFSTERYRKN
jgi:DNA polymerase